MSDQDQLLELFKNCSLFRMFPTEQLTLLLPHCEKLYLAKGEILFEQGDPSNYIYILIQGKCASYLVTPDIGEQIIGDISPMETIGELGALSGQVRSLNVRAITNAVLIKLPSEDFIQLCSKTPALFSQISQTIIKRSLHSIQTILPAYGPPFAIIVATNPAINQKHIAEQLKRQFKYRDAHFLNTEEMSIEGLLRLVDTERSKHAIFIYTKTWDKELFDTFRNNITHLYLTALAKEETNFNPILDDIGVHQDDSRKFRLELILIHPANTQRPKGTARWLKKADFSLHHHIREQHVADFQRMARFLLGEAYTLVLGGGSVRGFVHMGVISGLISKGVCIDAIGGTSAGACMAACYAFYCHENDYLVPARQLRDAFGESLQWKHIAWPSISLFSAEPLTQMIKRLFQDLYLEDSWIPYFAVSSNLSLDKQMVHRTGLVWEALRAASAIPGMFPPLAYHGQLLYDGALLNILPVDVMRKLVGQGNVLIASSFEKRRIPITNTKFSPTLPLMKILLSKLHLIFGSYKYPPFFETFLESLFLGASTKERYNSAIADILIQPDISHLKVLTVTQPQEEQMMVDLGYQEALIQLERLGTLQKMHIESLNSAKRRQNLKD